MSKTIPKKPISEKVNIMVYVLLFAALMPEYIAPLMTVIAAILFFKYKKQSGLGFKPSSMGVILCAFILWMVICLVYSSSLVSGLASIALWSVMFTGFWVFAEVIDSKQKADKVILCAAVSGGVCGATGIMQMVLYHISKDASALVNPFWRFLDLLIEKLVSILPRFIISNLAVTKFHTFPQRGCGTFSNPLFFSAFEVMMLPFCVYGFLFFESRKKRLACLLMMLLTIGGIASSYSRGPYLAMLIVLLVLLLYGGKKALKLGAVCAGAGSILLVSARGILKRLLTLKSADDLSLNTRKNVLGAVWDLMKKRPIFGYGTGFDNVRQLLHARGVIQPHAHNILFEIELENGILGVALFLAMCVVFVINVVKMFVKNRGREYAITIFASFLGFFMCGMTDCLFYGLKPLQTMMIILGFSQALFHLFLGENQADIIPAKVKAKCFKNTSAQSS